MEATKLVNWKTRDGKEVEAVITKTRDLIDKHLDGQYVGKETLETFTIKISIGGKFETRTHNAPSIITPRFYRNYEQMKAAGIYAHISGNVYVNEGNYNLVMAAIAEAEVIGTEEFAAVKAEEEARDARRETALKAEAAHHARLVKSGLCTMCGTWCYGDCEASQRY